MLRNYLTLVIIPQKTSRVIRFRLSQLFLKSSAVFGVLLVLVTVWVLYDYLKMRQVRSDFKDLQKSLMVQQVSGQQMKNHLNIYYEQLKSYEEFDRKLRVISGAQDNLPRLQYALDTAEEDLVESNESGQVENQLFRQLKTLFFHTKLRQISFFQLESFLQDRQDRLARTPSIKPTKGYLTSPFGIRRDPFTGRPKSHLGIDWANRTFTPIYAPAEGVVTATFFNAGFGNFLVVDHGYGIITRYAHLAKYEVNVGQKVKRGDLIGRMGSSGYRSTGSHLHYEVIVDNKHVNPERYILE